MIKRIGFLLTFVVLCGPISAAEIVGRSQIQGREIEIFADGTWSWADRSSQTSQECAPDDLFISENIPVAVCFSKKLWTKSTDHSGEFDVQYISSDGRLYAGVIIDPLPIGIEALRQAILWNAEAMGFGKPTRIEESSLHVNGLDLRTIKFSVEVKDTTFRFFDAYTSIEGVGAVQLAFWTVESVFDNTQHLRESVAASVRLTEN